MQAVGSMATLLMKSAPQEPMVATRPTRTAAFRDRLRNRLKGWRVVHVYSLGLFGGILLFTLARLVISPLWEGTEALGKAPVALASVPYIAAIVLIVPNILFKLKWTRTALVLASLSAYCVFVFTPIAIGNIRQYQSYSAGRSDVQFVPHRLNALYLNSRFFVILPVFLLPGVAGGLLLIQIAKPGAMRGTRLHSAAPGSRQ
jgi:hypothetical protein